MNQAEPPLEGSVGALASLSGSHHHSFSDANDVVFIFVDFRCWINCFLLLCYLGSQHSYRHSDHLAENQSRSRFTILKPIDWWKIEPSCVWTRCSIGPKKWNEEIQLCIIKQNIIVHTVRERLNMLVAYMIMVCDIKALNIWQYMTWTTRYGACGVLWWWVEQRARGHCIFAYSWAGVFSLTISVSFVTNRIVQNDEHSVFSEAAPLLLAPRLRHVTWLKSWRANSL